MLCKMFAGKAINCIPLFIMTPIALGQPFACHPKADLADMVAPMSTTLQQGCFVARNDQGARSV